MTKEPQASAEAKTAKLNQFFFPDIGLTIEADTIEQATEYHDKMMRSEKDYETK